MRSIEGLQLQDGGREVDWSEVGAERDAVSEAHEGVDSRGLGLEVVVGEREEGADGVDVDEDEVVLVVGGDAALGDQLALVKIVPVLVPVELVHLQGLLVHVRSDVEGGLAVDAVVESHVAGHCHHSVGVDRHHVLVGSQCDIDHEGINMDGLVDQGIVSVSEADESVDLGVLGGLVPGSAHQEGAHDVPVDGEEEVSVGRVDAGLVERVGSAQIVPVLGLEEAVDCWPDVEERGESPSSGGCDGRVEVICRSGICKCKGGAESEQE